MGQLMCRIVTCVPPWTWDPACATSPVLYDPGTRWHDRPCLHEGFNDVPPRAYYADAVKWMADEGITTGMKSDLFGPDELVNRAQFATFLWRYEGQPQVEPSNKFNDVETSAFYARAVAWMVEQRITTGRTLNRFDPNSNVSRAESIVFLHRLAGEPQGSARIEFSDVGPDAWYRDALAWVLEHNIDWWAEHSTLDAEKPASRAEIAALLHGYDLRPSTSPSAVAP
ncbi:MAG: S-layer homology domain-containing protein [Acidimicrobiaceae bacterium]|nr:S-layer homology domain-containing protein [Acidimicrobiaceae bacterium]